MATLSEHNTSLISRIKEKPVLVWFLIMRRTTWRNDCSEKTLRAQNIAVQANMFILSELGPTGFAVREEGNRNNFSVRIGDPHTCTCPDFRKSSSELCTHISWILLKKFRIPKEDPISWQLGLVEREIDDILRGYGRSQRTLPPIPKMSSKKEQEDKLSQRQLDQEDVCPVCQEEFFSGNRKPVSYCRYGCGNSVHTNCIKLWAEHQQGSSSGFRKFNSESTITCPMCRGNFCKAAALKIELISVKEYLNGNRPISVKNNTRHHGPALQQAIGNIGLDKLISAKSYNGYVPGADVGNEASAKHIDESTRTIKEVKISFKRPKLGLQCFQCLKWFLKGEIVYQLPCRHLIHKSCVNEKKMECVMCHEQYVITRASAAACAPTKASQGNPLLSTLPKQVFHGKSSRPDSAQRKLSSTSKQYVADLSIGHIALHSSATAKSNTIKPNLAKTALAPQPAFYRPGNSMLSSSFCLTATPLNNIE